MLQRQGRRKWPLLLFVLALLLLPLAFLMAGVQQLSLPLTGLLPNRQVMPPDPGDWCRKVDLDRLEAEVTRAETYFHEGVGEQLVDWAYLRRALRHTGVLVTGPEDSYWLETVKALYAGCR